MCIEDAIQSIQEAIGTITVSSRVWLFGIEGSLSETGRKYQ